MPCARSALSPEPNTRMKLDRELNEDSPNKYSLVLNRAVKALPPEAAREVNDALKILRDHGVLDDGRDPIKEFFVIRLRDKYAAGALRSYAQAASEEDPEYGQSVHKLMRKSLHHASRHKPN